VPQNRRRVVIAFPNSNPNSACSALSTVTCAMLRAPLSSNSAKWPPISVKARQLQQEKPSAAAMIEELLDELLEDVG
jgi:hypothetical protein